ncbi:uncharacterized protein At2g34160-like [Typha angustifolia]|uniref:uncharacterized protein At2g34160-like n=1 Tax=Typha angustifolia TaxID=59011 RepID=UPI003C306B8B
MEEVTETVDNPNINDSHKKNRIQVSNTKKLLFSTSISPSAFPFLLADDFLVHNGVSLTAIAELIKVIINFYFNFVTEIMTSTVDMRDESRGRLRYYLGTTENFDELMAAAAEERDVGVEEEQS